MDIDYSTLQTKLDNLEIQKQPKTFLQLLNKTYDEVSFSKYLSYFLDEGNTCREIIKEILSITSSGETIDFLELLDSASFEYIQTEKQISQQSRLDIFLKYSNFWIVIENKILSYESRDNQTLDYEKHIQKLNTEDIPVKYIYLKPKHNISKPSNDNFKILLYDDLFKILKNIKPEDLTDKENYFYLQDLIKHIEEYFMKNNQLTDSNALQFYLANKDKIDNIVKIYESESQKIRTSIVEQLKLTFPDFEIHDTSSYIQVFKSSWENRGSTGIHFELAPYKTNWDLLLGNTAVRIKFAIHNEKNTKEKYTSIPQETFSTKEFFFNNSNKIEESIQNILQEVQSLVDKYAKTIDNTISSIKRI